MSDDAAARWQEIRIAQFGYLTSTVLGLSTAALGFALAIAHASGGVWRDALFVAIGLLLLSHVFAIWCALNRLWDFRATYRRAAGKPGVTLDDNKERGDKSWVLLYCQLATFGLGMLVLTIGAWPSTLPK